MQNAKVIMFDTFTGSIFKLSNLRIFKLYGLLTGLTRCSGLI